MMSQVPFVLRAGLPHFARKVFAREPVRIVVVGTSMSMHGRSGIRTGARYLDGLRDALAAQTGNTAIDIVTNGREGLTSSEAVFRFDSDAVALRPDLVIFEFAHNETSETALRQIPDAAHAMLGKLWSTHPGCDALVVQLAPPGNAASAPTAAMAAWEAIATRFGLPSMNVAAFIESVVAAGAAVWEPGRPNSLTVDGLHHAEHVSSVVAPAFSRAFADIVAASGRAMIGAAQVVPTSPYLRAARIRPEELELTGAWMLGMPSDGWYSSRNAAAYDEIAAASSDPGASFTVRYRGVAIGAWLGSVPYRIRVEIDDAVIPLVNRETTPYHYALVAFGPDVPDGDHLCRVTVEEGTAIFGDIYVT